MTTWNKLSHRLKQLNAVSLDLHLDNHAETHIYTSGSVLSGHVSVLTDKDVAVEALSIDFLGEASTTILTSLGDPRHTRHLFLKLSMPLPAGALPAENVFRAFQAYSVPFTFTVPAQLPSKACKHTRDEELRERHLRLPPSMGYWEGKDQAPHAARVDYSVRAILTPRPKADGRPAKQVSAERVVKVLPTQPAPSAPSFADMARYTPAKDKAFHRDLLSHKSGTIRASATVPEPIVLAPDGTQTSEGRLRVNVEFTPKKGEAALPDVHAKSMHVEAYTHYSYAHINVLADRHDSTATCASLIAFCTSHKVAVPPSKSLDWTTPADSYDLAMMRRDSGLGLESSDEEGAGPAGKGLDRRKTHTTTLTVPISLPINNKMMFLPSFSSCIASRSYNLRLTLGTGSITSTITLNVPLDIVVEGGGAASLPDYTQINQAEPVIPDVLPPYTP